MTADQAGRMRFMARWHRRVALFVMAWLAVLAASGIVVNHANDWGLDRKPLAGPLQQLVYGVENTRREFCKDEAPAGADCGSIFARLELPGGTLLLAEHSLYLLDAEGGLVEKLPASQAGLGRLDAGFAKGEAVYLRGAGQIVLTGTELLEFRPVGEDRAAQIHPSAWQANDLTAAITWERLLLDLHAARFLGPLSKAFNDIIGGLILLLALSGFWLHRLKARANGNGRHM